MPVVWIIARRQEDLGMHVKLSDFELQRTKKPWENQQRSHSLAVSPEQNSKKEIQTPDPSPYTPNLTIPTTCTPVPITFVDHPHLDPRPYKPPLSPLQNFHASVNGSVGASKAAMRNVFEDLRVLVGGETLGRDGACNTTNLPKVRLALILEQRWLSEVLVSTWLGMREDHWGYGRDDGGWWWMVVRVWW
jgi:hypothetical protein